MEELFNNIIENTPQAHFWIIWLSGVTCSFFYSFIISLYNAIENKIWRMIDYEKIINEHLEIYVGGDNKEKKLIAQAKENVEKRNLKKQKRDKILNKIFNRRKKDEE